MQIIFRLLASAIFATLLCQCGGSFGGGTPMGGPTAAERKAKIASEPAGDFFYGRRYYVKKTRFWGYLRKPRQSWDKAKLVILREDRKKSPDRLPEEGSARGRFGFDQNYEYKIKGHYTGSSAYDPNSNQVLPVFMLTAYEIVDRNPGWIFRPNDRYDPLRITLYP